MSLPAPSPAIVIEDVPSVLRESLVENYRVSAVRSNRAGVLGHPCLRYLTYLRTRWEEMMPPEPELLQIFREGRVHEQAVLDQLREAGYNVILQQYPFAYRERPELMISGKIDGAILLRDRRTIPFDVKSFAPATWHQIEEHNEMSVREHRHYWVRNAYAQLLLYDLMDNQEVGLLFCKNKATGQLKQVEVYLDFAYAETLLQKAAAVNRHVAAHTLPDRIPYSQAICGRCDAFAMCLPDEALRVGATLVDDPAFEAQLTRRAELEAAASEFKRLDEAIKERVKVQLPGVRDPATQKLVEGGEAVIGTRWVVRTLPRSRTTKPSAGGTTEYLQVEIEKLIEPASDAPAQVAEEEARA